MDAKNHNAKATYRPCGPLGVNNLLKNENQVFFFIPRPSTHIFNIYINLIKIVSKNFLSLEDSKPNNLVAKCIK